MDFTSPSKWAVLLTLVVFPVSLWAVDVDDFDETSAAEDRSAQSSRPRVPSSSRVSHMASGRPARKSAPRQTVQLTGIEADADAEIGRETVDEPRVGILRKIRRSPYDLDEPAATRVPEPEPAVGPALERESDSELEDDSDASPSWFESCFCQPCCDLSNDPCMMCCFDQQLLIPRIGAVAMHRSQPRDDVLIFNPFDPTQNLNANQFEFGWGGGLDAGATFLNAFSPGNDLDVHYWGINDWGDQQFLAGTGLATQINSAPPTLVAGAQNVTANLSTQLHSFEVNWRHRWEDRPFAFIAGFRSIELYDDFDATLADPNGILTNSKLQIHTRNHLYGFQSGFDAPLINSCRLCVRGFAKAGVFGNATANNSLYRCNCVPPVTYRAGDTSDRVSVLTEVGVNGRFSLGRQWWIYSQYQAMWLGGVSTATDQLTHTNFATGNGIYTQSGVFFHGGMIGLERAF